jgi:hypothetical protein
MPEHSDFKDWVKQEITELKRIRDELRVKAHLGKAEARDRWQSLERSYAALESKVQRASRAADAPLRELESDLRKLAKDLREGYRQIRDAI